MATRRRARSWWRSRRARSWASPTTSTSSSSPTWAWSVTSEGKGAKYLFVPPGYEGDVPRRRIRGASSSKTNRFLICARCPIPDPEKGNGAAADVAAVPLGRGRRSSPATTSSSTCPTARPSPTRASSTARSRSGTASSVPWTGTCRRHLLQRATGCSPTSGSRKDRPFEPDDDCARSSPRQPRRPTSSSSWPRSPTTHPSDWSGRTGAGSGSSTPKATTATTSATSCTCRSGSAGSIRRPSRPSKMFMHKQGAGSIYWLANVDGDGQRPRRRPGLPTHRTRPGPRGPVLVGHPVRPRHPLRDQHPPVQARPHLPARQPHPDADGNITLHFGPTRPDGDVPWLQTNPGSQWFAYFRLYGPGDAAFDGTWKPSDIMTT